MSRSLSNKTCLNQAENGRCLLCVLRHKSHRVNGSRKLQICDSGNRVNSVKSTVSRRKKLNCE